MGEHFRAYSAVFPLILKESAKGTEILLHRRQNTGYQDGKWDIAASGHVDEGETAKAALVRECAEELGIRVHINDVEFVHLSHRLSWDRTYYDIYFVVSKYEGEPMILEPDKCSELKWFDINSLPDVIIECRKTAIEAYLDKNYYGEIIEKN